MAEVSGRVIKVHHDVGDIVKPGDVLLEIDPTDYELAVQETRRSLELDVTRIGLGDRVPPDDEIQPDKVLALMKILFDIHKLPSVIRAKQQEENARQRMERARQLRERNSISAEEFDQRSTDYEIAVNNHIQAQWDAQAVVAGIKLRLVTLRIVMRKLEHTRIKVPMPTQRLRLPKDVQYAVVERKVTEGEMLKDAPGASSATFELVMDGVLKLRASVPERFVSQVKEGHKAEVRVEAYPDRVFPAEVMHISPMIDRTSRTFQVELYVENPQRELKAGGFAKVEILSHVDPRAWTVPAEALVSYAGSTKIFVIRDGKAHAVPVATGVEGRGWLELVRSFSPDLRQDDQVITSGQEKLAEGVTVAVRGEKKE
jgi:multidrug efflux pump subunit AcrA (membrane-fusion protein)